MNNNFNKHRENFQKNIKNGEMQEEVMQKIQNMVIPLLTLQEKITIIPDYSIALLCGAEVTESYLGNQSIVQIVFDSKAGYVNTQDYQLIKRISEELNIECLQPMGLKNTRLDVSTALVLRKIAQDKVETLLISPDSKGILFIPADYCGCGHYRMFQPMKALESLGFARVKMAEALSIQNSISMSHVLIQRVVRPISLQMCKQLKLLGKKLVFENDDLLEELPYYNPNRQQWENEIGGLPRIKLLRKEMIDISDKLIVSTKSLADEFIKLGADTNKIHICPNFIDLDSYKTIINRQKDDGKIRILWAGSNTHKDDFDEVNDVLAELLMEFPNLVLCFMGYTPEKLAWKYKNRIETKEFAVIEKFAEEMSKFGADIAIAPLKNITFNKVKSNVKFLESAMLKIPLVASDIEAYSMIKQRETGFLCNDKKECKEALRSLITNEALRRNVGNSAYEFVVKNYSTEAVINAWKEVFN